MKKLDLADFGSYASIISLCIAGLSLFAPNEPIKIISFVLIIIIILLLIYLNTFVLEIREIEVKYIIDISSDKGDVTITKHIYFENNSNKYIDQIRQRAFSTGSPVNDDNLLNLKACDDEGHKLNTKITLSRPNLKIFYVAFNKSISPKQTYSFSHKLFWPKLFTNEEEFFIAEDNARIVEFCILAKNGISLDSLIAKEVNAKNSILSIKEINRNSDILNNEHKLRVMKKFVFNNVELTLGLKFNNPSAGGGGGGGSL